MRRLLVCAGALLVGTTLPALGADTEANGRYQIVVIQPPSPTAGTEAFILDTRDGNLWRYWASPTLGAAAGNEGLKYITQMRPGRPGEVVWSQRYK